MKTIETVPHKWAPTKDRCGEPWMMCLECHASYRPNYGGKMPSDEQQNNCYRIISPVMNRERNKWMFWTWEILRRFPDRAWRLKDLARDVGFFCEHSNYVPEGAVRGAVWSLASQHRVEFDGGWRIVALLTEEERAQAKNLLLIDPRRVYVPLHKL